MYVIIGYVIVFIQFFSVLFVICVCVAGGGGRLAAEITQGGRLLWG